MSGDGKLLLDDATSKAIASLLGRIVHDFNNPLAAIIGFADLLRNPNLAPEKQARYVARVYEQAIKLSQLVETMSYFSSSPEPHAVPTNLCRSLADIVSLREGGLQGAGIELAVEGTDGNLEVLMDRAAVGRIAHALFNNAEQVFKENPLAEDRKVRLRCFGTAEYGILEIADSGPGIATEHLDNIFDPFFSTRRSGGLGLGLTISRGLARKMGGDLVLVESQDAPYGGACFQLRLPLAGQAD